MYEESSPAYGQERPFYGWLLTRFIDDIRRYASVGDQGLELFNASVEGLSSFLANKHDKEYIDDLQKLQRECYTKVKAFPDNIGSITKWYTHEHFKYLVLLMSRANVFPSEGFTMDVPVPDMEEVPAEVKEASSDSQ